ncbi:MAG: hypothetical protein JXB50_02485 [Spirochaetes bacterium]|nr:hypothetical protein [Spirochaetota bacterium]
MRIRLVLLFLFNIFFLFSKEVYEPSWIYLKRAENYTEQGNYSQAVIEARKAKKAFINEKLKEYYEDIRMQYKNKIEYELIVMVNKKEAELVDNDNFPQFHEIMADIYIKTNMLDQGIEEYKKSLSQKKFFEYSQKELEIKYKLANVYTIKKEFELAEIIYSEIVDEYFMKKNDEFWSRIKYNIKNDASLNLVFKIYRIDGIEYLEALYKIGKRNAILQRKEESLYYLVNAAIVWMTYYSNIIKKYHYEFQYSNPTDFINYISKKRLYEFESKDYIMDEIFYYIGYIYLLENQSTIKNHYFNLAKIFSKNTDREEEIQARIDYFNINPNYRIKIDEY